VDSFSSPEAETEGGEAEARRARRDSMFLHVAIRRAATGEQIEGRVRNLSAEGMMVESTAAATAGEAVTIALKRIGEVEGTIAWVRDGRFGVRFSTPIDPRLARAPIGSARKSPHAGSAGAGRPAVRTP
jgi:hypothetical protein